MMIVLAAFGCGLLFGLGLIVSQMIDPAKVLAFLDVTARWDPSLAFVMVGAIAASFIGIIIAKRRGVPVLETKLEMPDRRDIDTQLVAGAALFGVGWGLLGLCPGPAIAILPLGHWQGVLFVTAMLAGMALFGLMSKVMPKGEIAPSLKTQDADA